MLDIMGAMVLTAIAILGVGALIVTGTRDPARRFRLAGLAAAWFVVVAGLAAAGAFAASTRLGTPGIGAAVAVPAVAGVLALATSRSARRFAEQIPLAVLVGVHVARLLGGFMVALHAAGRLPPTFGLTAGWGDVFVAAMAGPLAWAIHRRASGWRALAWAWNSVGMLDLLVAVTLGVGSAPGSPLRFIFESPGSGAMGGLPWLMIPGFLVPVYMLTHVAVFRRLGATVTHEGRVPMRSAA